MVHYTRSHDGLSSLNIAGVTSAQKGTLMKRHCFTSYPLFALIGLILLPLAVVHASPPPDYEQWRRDHPRPAGKALANLNVGEPRTVRMLYFSPSDRPHRATVVDSMKTLIRQLQTFFAEQMQAHGYGNKTFRFETDAQGEPLVHRFSGPDPHVIPETFDVDRNVYFVFADVGDIGYGGALGTGHRNTKNGGVATVSKYGFGFGTAAHELGHAFGLPHDFRDGAYIMSYSWHDRLSACAAEFLAVHTYFNSNTSIATSASVQPTIEVISSYLYPPGSASVPIRLKLGSSKGLHQAILLGRSGRYLFGVQECRGFAGEKETVARFEYDLPSFSYFAEHPLSIIVVDGDGNAFGDGGHFAIPSYRWSLVERSPYMVATLRHRGEIADALSFSPDGSLLATASRSEILLWDVASRQKIATLQHEAWAPSLSFSPDGSLLATTSGGKIFLWDVASRQQIATLHQGGYLPSFSPDGSLLATTSGDEVWLWDVASRQKIATLQHENWV
ncbi:MAG: hypothetical protein F4X17_14385, partial [Gemmatimonadetes bacterium]|nr:hypothetical protein [Gemmatimonadota bacterium]